MAVVTSYVVRIRYRLIVRLMTAVAVRGQVLVLIIHVTGSAVDIHVRAGQGEAGVVVIEVPTVPAVHGVALETIVREAGRLMIGIVGIQVVLRMARIAVGWRVLILTADMALSALHGYVSTHQREPGIVMVECGRLPGVRRVACRACVRKLVRHVIRVRRGVVIGLMA